MVFWFNDASTLTFHFLSWQKSVFTDILRATWFLFSSQTCCFNSVTFQCLSTLTGSPFHLYFLLFLLPWIGLDNLLLLLKARSPLGNSVTCLSGHISMEDLQSQTSTSMDWLSKFTQTSVRLHCRPLISSASTLSSCVWLNWGFFKNTK